LLRHQNTARSTLTREFTRQSNKEWRRLQMFLIRNVVPKAKELVDRDIIHGEIVESLEEIVTLFNDHYGAPVKEIVDGPPIRPTGPRPPGPKRPGPTDEPGPRRYNYIRVRDKTYRLYYGRSLYEYTLAEF